MPALGIIGLIAGVAGTGLSYAAQMNAASTQATFSNLNAQAGVQQAQQQGAMAAIQNTLQSTQARTQQQSAQDNAEAEREQAENDAKVQQENLRRGRDDFMRTLSAANAQAGGSGAVIATGSPLEVLMSEAQKEQQQEQDQIYGINAGRASEYRHAAGTALGGAVQGMNSDLYQIQSLAAVEQGREGATQARLGGLAGAAQAQGLRNSAFGGLLGGVASNVNAFGNSSLNPWRPPKY